MLVCLATFHCHSHKHFFCMSAYQMWNNHFIRLGNVWKMAHSRELFSYSPSRISCTVKHWKWQLPLFIQCFMYETCRHIGNGSTASYINSLFALLGEQRKNNIQSKHNKYEHCDGTLFLVSLLLLLSFMFKGFCPHFLQMLHQIRSHLI